MSDDSAMRAALKCCYETLGGSPESYAGSRIADTLAGIIHSEHAPAQGETAELADDHCCVFCGHDPYHYVDNGLGMETVAVTCCENGAEFYGIHHRDEVTIAGDDFRAIAFKLGDQRAALSAQRAEIERLKADLTAANKSIGEHDNEEELLEQRAEAAETERDRLRAELEQIEAVGAAHATIGGHMQAIEIARRALSPPAREGGDGA